METLAKNRTDLQKSTLAIVLAGGRGTRLGPLTDKRAKPAVYFGGKFRIIDFALSNCLNSGIRRIGVVTQYKSHSLLRHLQRGWRFLRGEFNEFIDLLPAQQRVDDRAGIAARPTPCLPEPRHHPVDRAGVRPRAGRRPHLQDGLLAHAARPRRAAARTARSAASRCRAWRRPRFGVMHVDARPPRHGLPRKARRSARHARQARHRARPAWASTCSTPTTCTSCSRTTSRRPELEPRLRQGHHPARRARRPRDRASVRHVVRAVRARPERAAYWRDVGTVDAFWAANLDLAVDDPELDLYDRNWPIWTYQEQLPPAKFVRDLKRRAGRDHEPARVAAAASISGSHVSQSVLFFGGAGAFVLQHRRGSVVAASDIGRELPPDSGRDRPRLHACPKGS